MIKKTKIEKIAIKNCNSIGEMEDYIIELNLLYDDFIGYSNSILQNLVESYRYFNENEFNRCYSKIEEAKRNIQIIRRKTDMLENRIFESTLPDNAMCFLFDENLQEINQDIINFNKNFDILMQKINFKFFLI